MRGTLQSMGGLREREVQRGRGTTSPDPKKQKKTRASKRTFSEVFLWELLEKKKPLRASKGHFSSKRLTEGPPPPVPRTPARPQGGSLWKKFQSFSNSPREYRWEPPRPSNSRHWKPLASGAPGLHALQFFGINFVLITLTLTPLIVFGINFKSVIGGLWGYTCTLEIALTLLNSFQINFAKITLTLVLVFELQM